jgi:hypothetical protein
MYIDIFQTILIFYLILKLKYYSKELSYLRERVTVPIQIESDQNYLLQRYRDEVQNKRFSSR